MPQRKNVSMRKIAELCNVSVATVSRAISDDGKISNETKNMILQKMKEYQYIPATTSINKPQHRTISIGVVVAYGNSDYSYNLGRHITTYFKKRSINVLFCNSVGDYENESASLQALIDAKVSGIILISCHSKIIEPIAYQDIPTVWIDYDDIIHNDPKSLWVSSDHYVGGQLAATELINKDCTRPIILCNNTSSLREKLRLDGFFYNYSQSGIELNPEETIVRLPCINTPFIESRDMIQYLFTKGLSFDSIFAINDWRAFGAFIGVQNIGLKIPEDIKIISYDGTLLTSSVMNITSVHQNTELLALNACDLLWKKIRNEDIPQNHVIVPTTIIPGKTT